MESTNYETLNDIAPLVQEHLVPEIERAVEICVKSFWDDEFNDKWIFGTHLWKNIWNRFEMVTEFEDCPFEVHGKGNEYKLKIGNFIVRHHRVDRKTTIPRAAKAAKCAAIAVQRQLLLFEGIWDDAIQRDNIVIAIDADVNNGLREIFLGELLLNSLESKQYRWANKIPVYLAEGAEPSSEEFVHIEEIKSVGQIAPEEEIPEVAVGLDKSKARQITVESDGEK